MKKNESKKLRLSRETLQVLQDLDSREVRGALEEPPGSTQSACPLCPTTG